jgi:hypothetical protein
MKCQSAKAKGRRLQQKVAADIVRVFDELSEDDVRSVSMGCNGEDVLLSPLARTKVPFSIECKNTERLSIWNAIEQCKKNADGHPPLVVFKKNHSDMYAAVPWDALLSLLSAQYNNTNVNPSSGMSPTKKRRLVSLLDDMRGALLGGEGDLMETDTYT